MKYLKLFSNHSQYVAFTGTTDFVLPNVSYCIAQNEVHYNAETPTPVVPQYRTTSGTPYCDDYDKYVDVYSQVSYDSGQTWSTTATTPTLVESDSADCGYIPPTPPSGDVVVAKFNVTSTSSPTRILSNTSYTDTVYIDDVELQNVPTGYTFTTTGEHTVKYLLDDQTYLGSSFINCVDLTSIVIPNSVENIEVNTFSGCTNLSSCTIGSSVTSIGNNAFRGCTGLTSIEIPSGVTSIGASAFTDCFSITNMVIPNSVTSIGEGAFSGCGFTSCTIGSGITSIGDSVFNDCTSLTSIVIPNTVTTIGPNGFWECVSLSSVTIGSGVTSIGGYAFEGCERLEVITSLAMTAPTITSNTFMLVKENGTLYVPQGSTGYDVWMQNNEYYLGDSSWTKVEQ